MNKMLVKTMGHLVNSPGTAGNSGPADVGNSGLANVSIGVPGPVNPNPGPVGVAVGVPGPQPKLV